MFVRSRGLLVAALLTMAASASPLVAQKVGYVDSRKILQEMPGRTATENRIRAGLEALQERQKVMVDSLNAMMAAFERDSASLSQADKVTRFGVLQQYDVSREGRFLINVNADESVASPIMLIMNWKPPAAD